MEKYTITISRQFASLGRSIAQKMSHDLEINFYDRDIVETTAKRMEQSVSIISKEEENSNIKFFRRKYPLGMGVANMQDEIFNVQTNIIRDFAKKESCIIVGRCGNSILSDFPRCLNIFVYAPYEARLKNCTDVLGMDIKVAKKMIKEVDKARENYHLRYCKGAENIFDGYDIIIDSSKFGVDKTAEILTNIVKNVFL
ncbi:MAG: AAA family ATPase [Sedimentibacter sp.]